MTMLAGMRVNTLLRGSLTLCLAAGCGMDVDETSSPADVPPGVGEVEQSLTTVTGVDFEDYDAGPLGAPWQVARSLDTQASIERTSDHGNVLFVQGSAAAGDFVLARLDTSTPSDLVASVDVKPDSDSSFIWSIHTPRYKSRIRLQRWPGSARLVATAPGSGDADCGSLPAGQWSNLSLIVHTNPSVTFDVLLDGNPTPCQDIEANLTPPFTLVQLNDFSAEGWGGNVRFDNVRVLAP